MEIHDGHSQAHLPEQEQALTQPPDSAGDRSTRETSDRDLAAMVRPVYADRHLLVEQVLPLQELRFTGEIDDRNTTAVTRSVVAALDSGADLHLDLSAAEFCDSSGINALFAAAGSIASGRLVLHGLPPLIETTIRAVVEGRARRLAIRVSNRPIR